MLGKHKLLLPIGVYSYAYFNIIPNSYKLFTNTENDVGLRNSSITYEGEDFPS